MNRRIAALLFLIVSLASVSSAPTFAQSKTEVSNEEYAVYDVAIAKIFAQRAVHQMGIISPTVDTAEINESVESVGAAWTEFATPTIADAAGAGAGFPVAPLTGRPDRRAASRQPQFPARNLGGQPNLELPASGVVRWNT